MPALNAYFIVLNAACLAVAYLLVRTLQVVRNGGKSNFNYAFLGLVSCMLIWTVGQLFVEYIRLATGRTSMYAVYFYMVGVIFIPIFTVGFCYFYGRNASLSKKHLWIIALPLVSFIALITDNWEHLFFINYSFVNTELEFGPYFIVHGVISYSYLMGGIAYFIHYNVKTRGKKTKAEKKQVALVLFGMAVPVVVNIITMLKLINVPTYVSAEAFVATAITWYLAAFRYKLFNIRQVAVRHVFDYLKESILVVSNDNIIIDYNKRFSDIVRHFDKFEKGMSLSKLAEIADTKELKDLFAKLDKVASNNSPVSREFLTVKDSTVYYEIEVSEVNRSYKVVTLTDATIRHWQTIEVLIKTIDAKNKYTSGHSYRVAEYAIKIGAQLGLDRPTLYLLWSCGLAHDIGKIGVSDDILESSKRFGRDSYEFKEIMKHTEIGASILGSMEEFKDLADIVRYHHERIDGNGYVGLKGEEIPFLSKILAVADTYDAMSSGRKYQERPIKEPYEVINILMEGSIGAQLDPECFYALVSVLKNEGYIKRDISGRYIGTGKLHDFVERDADDKLVIKEEYNNNISGVAVDELYNLIS